MQSYWRQLAVRVRHACCKRQRRAILRQPQALDMRVRGNALRFGGRRNLLDPHAARPAKQAPQRLVLALHSLHTHAPEHNGRLRAANAVGRR